MEQIKRHRERKRERDKARECEKEKGIDRIDTQNLDTPRTRRLSFARYDNMVIKQRLLAASSVGRYSGDGAYHSTYNHVLYAHFSIFFVGSRVRFVGRSKFRPKQSIKCIFCYFVCSF